MVRKLCDVHRQLLWISTEQWTNRISSWLIKKSHRKKRRFLLLARTRNWVFLNWTETLPVRAFILRGEPSAVTSRVKQDGRYSFFTAGNFQIRFNETNLTKNGKREICHCDRAETGRLVKNSFRDLTLNIIKTDPCEKISKTPARNFTFKNFRYRKCSRLDYVRLFGYYNSVV